MNFVRAAVATTGICAWQGTQSAIHNPLKARQSCNPPQSTIRPAEHASSLQAFEPGTAPAQGRPQF
eukprot:6058659-Alexandrium_andersonii.AAC.1